MKVHAEPLTEHVGGLKKTSFNFCVEMLSTVHLHREMARLS